MANRAAQAMSAICNNPNVGYGQADRTSSWAECQRIGWDINRIGEIQPCNTDCSETTGEAINFAYGKEIIPSYVYTGNIAKLCSDTGLFDVLNSVDESTLQVGDMPLKAGKHIIMVISTDHATNTITTSAVPMSDGGDPWVRRLQSLIGAGVDGRAGSETLSKCPNITYQTWHNPVTGLIQERLGNFYHIGVAGGVDNNYGDGTNAAFLEFKRQKGLNMDDGDMNPDVWKAILKDTQNNCIK